MSRSPVLSAIKRPEGRFFLADTGLEPKGPLNVFIDIFVKNI